MSNNNNRDDDDDSDVPPLRRRRHFATKSSSARRVVREATPPRDMDHDPIEARNRQYARKGRRRVEHRPAHVPDEHVVDVNVRPPPGQYNPNRPHLAAKMPNGGAVIFYSSTDSETDERYVQRLKRMIRKVERNPGQQRRKYHVWTTYGKLRLGRTQIGPNNFSSTDSDTEDEEDEVEIEASWDLGPSRRNNQPPPPPPAAAV